jgi:hypothetical protein
MKSDSRPMTSDKKRKGGGSKLVRPNTLRDRFKPDADGDHENHERPWPGEPSGQQRLEALKARGAFVMFGSQSRDGSNRMFDVIFLHLIAALSPRGGLTR